MQGSYLLCQGTDGLTLTFISSFTRKNISQKDIIQAALVEFLRKYGYDHEVKDSLKV